MVGTIVPVVYGERLSKVRRKSSSVLWFHIIGCLTGASILGIGLGLLGSLFPWQSLPVKQEVTAIAVTGIVSLLYAASDLGLIRVPTPQSRWQVPRSWSYQLWPNLTALSYGAGLGLGLATAIPVGTFYAIIIWTVLAGNPILGAVTLAAYGLGRASPLLLISRMFRSQEENDRFSRVLVRWRPVVRYLNGLMLAFTGMCLLIMALAHR